MVKFFQVFLIKKRIMSKIVFTSKKYTTVSVRLKSNVAEDIDLATKNIGIILGDEISRNQVLEKLIGDSNCSVFVINGEEMTFQEILDYTTVETVTEADATEDITDDVKDIEIENKEIESSNL